MKNSYKNIIIGSKYGRLTVLEITEPLKKLKSCRMVICKCDCENIVEVYVGNLLKGVTLSCGCYHLDKVKTSDGMSRSRIYNILCGMKARCYNKNKNSYKNYGGRGIKICQEWLDSFESFYDWSINNGYLETLTIDRIDNNKDYSPDNCKWSTRLEQGNNRRTNKRIIILGEEKTISEWSRDSRCSVEPSVFKSRVCNGWDYEEAFLTKRVERNERV